MRKIVVILTSMFLLSFMVAGFAANNNVKIGVVKIGSILKNSPKFSQTKTQMKNLLEKDRKTVSTARNNLQSEMSKLQKQGPKMSSTAKTALQAKIKTDQNNFIQLTEKVSKNANARQTKEMGALSASLKAAIKTVAKQEGLNFVFTDQSAVYFDNQFDITKKVAKVFG